MRIVFMGSPEFAVPSLEKLINSFAVIGVVTQPDRKSGRGRKLRPTPAKQVAVKNNIELFQPENIQQEGFVDKMVELAPDLFGSVAFGEKIPGELITLPRFDSINLHASLLPKYRGACPIHWAIINGEEETGLTTMFIDEDWDAGDIICQRRVPIHNDDTVSSLHDRLAEEGAELVVETVKMIASGRNPRRKQSPEETTLAPCIKREDARINWGMPAEKIRNLIRGTNPWPGAFTFYDDLRLKILAADILDADMPATAELVEDPERADPGTVVGFTEEDEAIVRTGIEGEYVILKEVQPESRSRMDGGDFSRGYRLNAGDRFSSSEEMSE